MMIVCDDKSMLHDGYLWPMTVHKRWLSMLLILADQPKWHSNTQPVATLPATVHGFSVAIISLTSMVATISGENSNCFTWDRTGDAPVDT